MKNQKWVREGKGDGDLRCEQVCSSNELRAVKSGSGAGFGHSV